MHNTGSLLLKLVTTLFSLLFIFPALIFSILVLTLTDNAKSGTVMLITVLILYILVKCNNLNHSFSQRENDNGAGRWEQEASGDWSFHNESPPPPLDEIYFEIDCWNEETNQLFQIIRDREQACDSEGNSSRCSKCKQIGLEHKQRK